MKMYSRIDNLVIFLLTPLRINRAVELLITVGMEKNNL